MKTLIRSFAIVAALSLGVSSVASATALSAARQTASKNPGAIKRYLMTDSVTIYAGSLVMLVNAGTVQAAAATASNQGIVGIALETLTSATADKWIKVQEGWFLLAGVSISQGDVGLPMYALDDQTIDETALTNQPCAGVLMEYVSSTSGWVHVALTFTARWASSADPITFTGDVTLGGGAGALTMTDSATSFLLPDNDTTALVIGSTDQTNLMTFDTGDDTETVIITGVVSTDAFHVDIGNVLFDEAATITGDLSLGGGATALTFSAASSSIVVPDASAAALVIGSTGDLDLLQIVTSEATEKVVIDGTTTATAFHVDVGDAQFDEDVIVTGILSTTGGVRDVTDSTCVAGEIMIDTATTVEICVCTATNTIRCVATTTSNPAD